MEFYSLVDILTNPVVATLVVATLTAGLHYAFGWESRWTALVMALLVVVGGYLVQVLQAGEPLNIAQLFLQVVWAGLVYAAAAGVSSGAAAVQEQRMEAAGNHRESRGFQRYW